MKIYMYECTNIRGEGGGVVRLQVRPSSFTMLEMEPESYKQIMVAI